MTETSVHAHDRNRGDETSGDHFPGLVRFEKLISVVCAVLAGVSLVAITLLTVGEVFSRTLLAEPLGWNVGLVEQYFMMSMAFFGAVTGYQTGAHIAVTTVYDRLPPVPRKTVTVLAHLIVLTGFALLAWAGAGSAYFSFQFDEAPVPGMAELPLPTWWWKSIMPIAGILGSAIAVCELIRTVAGNAHPRCTKPPTGQTEGI